MTVIYSITIVAIQLYCKINLNCIILLYIRKIATVLFHLQELNPVIWRKVLQLNQDCHWCPS